MTDAAAAYEGQRALITGGLGFIGSALAIRLAEAGARVTVADPMLPLYGGNLFNIAPVADRVSVQYADIRDDGAMRQLVRDQDVIFHIGNQTSHVDSMSDPLLDADINCRGNLILAEACRHENPHVKLVYAGTRAQLGKLDTLPADEQARLNPVDVYGINKQAGEQYFLLYHRAYGLRATSLRLTNGYGPRHQMKHGKYGILNWFIRLALDDAEITLYGDGSQLREYVYIDDMADAFLLAGASDASDGQVYNIGSDRQVRFGDLTRLIIETAGSGKLTLVPWPEERKVIESGDFSADWTKFAAAFGWKPTVSLEDGLHRTIDFYRRNRAHYW
jgi:UDP-glucose 4-epimerase